MQKVTIIPFLLGYLLFVASLFPKLLANGSQEDKKLNFIVMPKYDVDIDRLFIMRKKKFKLETIITIGL